MKKNVYLWLCALVLTIVGLSSCSSDDEDSVERYALCHAWNWQDEMPKNYYDLIVYKLDGTIEVVQIIYTDEGFRKKVVNHGYYSLDGDRLTCRFNGRDESSTFRIVIEKNDEGGHTMYLYYYGDKYEAPSSWYNTYYTSDTLDETYRNTPEMI